MNFNGKTVVVTGAAAGIGQAVARAYAVAGASVVLADVDEKSGRAQTEAFLREGKSASFIRVDVRNEGEVIALVEHAAKTFGGPHILINNAGITRWKSVYELSLAEWEETLNTNLRGAFLCAREAARRMRGNGGGTIVNIASTRALMSEPDTEAYAASKGGLVGLTHALAVSLGPDRIRVNCISPGWIATSGYDELREIDHRQHPAGRVGKPEDIARACLYLTDPQNDFVTGINLVVDGGMTRKMIYEP
jgi:NAD(P)-dependent dehydrogenase (short-subunit alcohol dehydrogenase family)